MCVCVRLKNRQQKSTNPFENVWFSVAAWPMDIFFPLILIPIAPFPSREDTIATTTTLYTRLAGGQFRLENIFAFRKYDYDYQFKYPINCKEANSTDLSATRIHLSIEIEFLSNIRR